MNAKPTLARPRVVTTVAAALSTVIAIGLLTAVTGLFQRDGAPFEQVVIAEHACANHTFISEREACVRLYLAASRVQNAVQEDRLNSIAAFSPPARQSTSPPTVPSPNKRQPIQWIGEPANFVA